MKKNSPSRTVIMFFVLLVLVVGLSIVSNRIWGGKPELPQKRKELRIDAGMTIIQFGQANNLPDAVLKEIFDLTGTIRDMTKENGGKVSLIGKAKEDPSFIY